MTTFPLELLVDEILLRLEPAGLETAEGGLVARPVPDFVVEGVEAPGFLTALVVGVLDFCEAAGRAFGPPAAGRAFFAPCVEGRAFGAPVGFTAVFFAGADTGPSEDIDRLIESP